MGYLELPQVDVPGQKLTPEILQSKHVYLLDCWTDVFIWLGKKSTRLVRAAAAKLSHELYTMMDRPAHAGLQRVQEGTETQVRLKSIEFD